MVEDEELGSEKFCRICLGDQHEQGYGELLTPCNCTGSLRHVHRKCFDTWTKNGPMWPESGSAMNAVFGLLTFSYYYWLCLRVRCELCGTILVSAVWWVCALLTGLGAPRISPLASETGCVYRVKAIRLQWIMRWMIFAVLLSTLLIASGMILRIGPLSFRHPFAPNQMPQAKARVGFPLDLVRADSDDTYICFVPQYQRWLYCFEARTPTPDKTVRYFVWPSLTKS